MRGQDQNMYREEKSVLFLNHLKHIFVFKIHSRDGELSTVYLFLWLLEQLLMRNLLCVCLWRSRQSYFPCEGPDHPHQSPEAEAPVSGGASGALPAGAQKALHQRGSELTCLIQNIIVALNKQIL